MKKFNLLILLLLSLFTASCQGQSQQTNTGNDNNIPEKISDENLLTHKNLTVMLIRGNDKLKNQYLTLEEAMDNKSIIIHETGNVGELSADNKSDKYIFILSGDIVKGGRQDRTIAEDMILKPGSKNVPLKSFCVEQSRWSQRGGENVAEFSSSKNMLSNKNLKIAAREKKEQQEVWKEVADFQDKASENVKTNVKSNQSATSLQLTLENKDLQTAVKEYITAVEPLFKNKKDILGFAFCVNGKISTIDIFGNAALFEKLKVKLIESAANEAVVQYKDELEFEVPVASTIQNFIENAEKGNKTTRNTGEDTMEEKITSDNILLFHTLHKTENSPVHTVIYNTDDIEMNFSQKFKYGGINR